MKTIAITLVALVSLAAGCKKQEPAKAVAVAKDSGQAPAGPGSAPAAKDSSPPPAAPGSGSVPTPGSAAAGGGLPPECNEYKAAIDRLATCDKFPKEARDALKNAYDAASADWASLPADGKAALKESCRGGADGIMTAAKATCGW